VKTYEGVLAALADPTRRSILELLHEGERSVGEIAADLPVSRPAVSQHLRVLQGAGLVGQRRDGTRRIYRAQGAGLLELQAYLQRQWGDVLRAFRAEAEAAARARGDHGPESA
jgi:DNA-binding transcriptional ArsR family regulator